MADNNLSGTEPGPDVTTPPTQEQLVEDISNLLEDPVPDLPEDDEDAPAAKPEDDDPLGLEAEDVETEDDSDDTDGSEETEVKGGRFAPDSAKVKLDNGETITIADLKVRVDKRVKDFQRDYTEKSTALKAKEADVDQQAQTLSQFRDYATWYAENFLPQQPTPPSDPNDYVAWHNYRLEQDKWAAHAQAFQQFQSHKQAEDQQKAEGSRKQAEERLNREREALVKAIPVLKDPAKGKAAWDAIVAGAQEHFGITAEEVNGVADHRMLVALRAAVAYMRIKAKAPQVQQQVAQKPVRPGKRLPPNTQVSKEKQARTEQLRKSGSLDDFVAAASHLFE